jgi:hypothetical protein
LELTTALPRKKIADYNNYRALHYSVCYPYALHQLSQGKNIAHHNTYRASHCSVSYPYAMHQLSPRANAGERSNSISQPNSAEFQPSHRGHHFGDS